MRHVRDGGSALRKFAGVALTGSLLVSCGASEGGQPAETTLAPQAVDLSRTTGTGDSVTAHDAGDDDTVTRVAGRTVVLAGFL